MSARHRSLAPVVVAGATGVLAVTALVLALTTVSAASELISDNRANQ
jgi:hypothetical protein